MPRLLVLRIPSDMSRQDVKEQMEACNKFGEAWDADALNPLYTIKYGEGGKGAPFVSWVVEMRPDAWKAAKEQGRVFIEFQSCRVKEFLEVTRC